MEKNVHAILYTRLLKRRKRGVIKKFLKFLLKYGEYHSYIEAMMTTDWECEMSDEYCYIFNAFSWSTHKPKTPNQGWSYFDEEWIKLLTKSKN